MSRNPVVEIEEFSQRRGMVERKIAIGLILSRKYTEQVIDHIKPKLIESPVSRAVIEWCLEHFRRYGSVPGSTIMDIYEDRSERILDEDLATMIKNFLSSISRESEKSLGFNVPYYVEKTIKYLTIQKARRLKEDLDTVIGKNDEKKISVLIEEFRKQDTNQIVEFCNPIIDESLIRESFGEDINPVMRFGGDLGALINNELTRESFVSFMGREKIGKTWILTEVAFLAMKARLNVCMFELGDMSKRQLTRRFHVRMTGKPYRFRDKDMAVVVPIMDCYYNQDDSCELSKRVGVDCVMVGGKDGKKHLVPFEDAEDHIPCVKCFGKPKFRGSVWYKKVEFDSPLEWEEGAKAGKRFFSRMVGRDFRLVTAPTGTFSIKDMKDTLRIWEDRDGYVPDVVVVDYADIIRHEGSKDMRHGINNTWAGLRSISLEHNCLVVTATQTDAASYDKESVGVSNFSEDKRKHSHTTATFSINQTEQEKQLGLSRIGRVLVREDEFSISDQVYILQCMKIGRAILGSYRRKYDKK